MEERKFQFRFVERRFLAAINCTQSVEGVLVPVLLRITHWTKGGLPVSPPGLFPTVDFERPIKQCMESVIAFYQIVRYDNDNLK